MSKVYGLHQSYRDDDSDFGGYINFFATRELAEDAIKALEFYRERYYEYRIHELSVITSFEDIELDSRIKNGHSYRLDSLKYS